MQIPFGPRKPNEKETELLTKIGFDLNKLEQRGRYYYLEVPVNSKIKCNVKNPAFDRQYTTVSYNGVEVISINQKTAIYDSYCYFNVSENAVEEALAKPEVVEDEKAENTVKLTAFQQKVTDRLTQLVSIIFEDGAQRGYAKWIGIQLEHLRTLKQENTTEHDQLINSNAQYKKLLDMFPDWIDINNLQRKYEAQDVGAVMALAGTLGKDGEGLEKCSIM
jgi:hypothetical protein